MRFPRSVSALFAVLTAFLLAACVAPAKFNEMRAAEPTHWVVVKFADTEEEFNLAAMDALLEYELQADSALQSAGAGWIDGNEIGDHQYDLYFVGFDRTVMWDLIRPVFDSVPYAWSRVELRDDLDDLDPVVVVP